MSFLFFLIQYTAHAIQCNKFVCSESQVIDNKCLTVHDTTSYIWPCNNNTTETICNLDSGDCSAPSIPYSYPGEPCTQNSQCRSNNCLNSKCKGSVSGATCQATDDCDVGLYCKQGTCAPQIAIGGTGCTSDFDCVNDAGCNLNPNPSLSNCVGYFSLTSGKSVPSCSSMTSNLCASNFCVFLNNGYECVSAPTSVGSPYSQCNTDADCEATYENGQSFTGTCECGYNPDGNSYCSPMWGDTLGTSYIAALTAYIHRASQCHSKRRWDKACQVLTGWYETLQNEKANFLYAPYIKDSDPCLHDVVPDYFPIEDFSPRSKLLGMLMLILA